MAFPESPPYQWIEKGKTNSYNLILDQLVAENFYQDVLHTTITNDTVVTDSMSGTTPDQILDLLKNCATLSFEQSFFAMASMVAVVNKFVAHRLFDKVNTELLPFVSDFVHQYHYRTENEAITPNEIAGFTAALLLLDTIPLPPASQAMLFMGGTGGDCGLSIDGRKHNFSFNASTCTMIGLATAGIPVHKHHSLSYLSSIGVGGVEAIAHLGARKGISSAHHHHSIFDKTGILVTDFLAFHALPRLIRTFRDGDKKLFDYMHVVGPLASPSYRDDNVYFLGVSQDYSLEDIAQALRILHDRKVTKSLSGVLFHGLDESDTIAFDEVSPYTTDCLFINGEATRRIALDARDVVYQWTKDPFDQNKVFIEYDRKNQQELLNNNHNIVFQPDPGDDRARLTLLGSALGSFTYKNIKQMSSSTTDDSVLHDIRQEYIRIADAYSSRKSVELWENYCDLTWKALT